MARLRQRFYEIMIFLELVYYTGMKSWLGGRMEVKYLLKLLLIPSSVTKTWELPGFLVEKRKWKKVS